MRIASILVALSVAAVACLSSAAFAQEPASSAAPVPGAATQANGPVVTTDATSGAYILGRDDVVEVSLLGRQEFGGRARVQADGTIQLPLIGKVQVADKTTAETSEQIRKLLQSGGYYADPIVNVEVVSFASRYITVLGAFGAPGLIPMNRPYRLSEILAKVGGVRDGGAEYISVRSADGSEKKYVIKDIATGDQTQDPYVKAGDKLYAPLAEVYYVYGQVRSPGVFPVVANMTVQMALVRAGGVTEQGSDKGVEVTRGGKIIKLDSAAKILPGDVLFIKERLF